LAGLVVFSQWPFEIPARERGCGKIMFGELGYKKVLYCFYDVRHLFRHAAASETLSVRQPVARLLSTGARQFFLMAVISPAILVGIFHWVPSERRTPALGGLRGRMRSGSSWR